MRLAIDLLAPSDGQVRLLGADTVRQPSCRLRVGHLPLSFQPPSSLQVRDYVEALALLSGVPHRRVREAAETALERVGLLDKTASQLSNLSCDMLRRVRVAQVIAHDPEHPILDEPAAGLDPEERAVSWWAAGREARGL
ncbi:ABC-type multidrug transport system ATPase subunit [Symbiobacterium terraclitae]|uniref:ABC-type multidrug transport system ATPase subunit n=1 Tax=Symbiobacterium terraclitae TaxID=557451 RepID=A0ABS4JPA4_9FIRM|nr:ATP-binding cassette domain-containing protein [Symbiobacterium terraclitae]MBP2016821.1 ABC-type multidrug transport system ATPase subunit [Symbiobacterium terraclitae]